MADSVLYLPYGVFMVHQYNYCFLFTGYRARMQSGHIILTFWAIVRGVIWQPLAFWEPTDHYQASSRLAALFMVAPAVFTCSSTMPHVLNPHHLPSSQLMLSLPKPLPERGGAPLMTSSWKDWHTSAKWGKNWKVKEVVVDMLGAH